MTNLYNYKLYITNFLFLLFPFSLILGSFIVNFNILLLTIFSFLFYFKEIFQFRLNQYDKIILIFFIYIFAVFLINLIEHDLKNILFPKIILIKSFFYIRFLILYFIIRLLINKKIIKINWFITISAFFSFFVCFDIFIQFLYGKNIIGLEPISKRHFSGVFGSELIAGGYIQKFFIFIFFIPIIFNLDKKIKIYLNFLFFAIVCAGIILSGNRMPLFLSIITYFFYLLLDKDLRKKLPVITLSFFIFFLIMFLTNPIFKVNIKSFYNNSKDLIYITLTKDISKEPIELSQKPYVTEFYCGKKIFKLNPIFGGGVKSYRTHFGGCTSHPHNYFLEILTDLGIFGLSILLYLLYKIFKKLFFNINYFYNRNTYIFPFSFVILTEFFPIRSSGSFFTSNNSVVIFLFIAIIVSLLSKNPKLFKNH